MRAFATLLSLAALFAAVAAAAQNTIHVTTNYYRVTGATVAEIHQSFRQARPWKEQSSLDGFTDWRITWRFQTMPSPAGCRLSSFTSTTTIRITLPFWIAPTNATPEVTNAWRRYIAALGEHEFGHARNGINAATELHKRIQAGAVASDCAALQRSLNEVATAIVNEHRSRDAEYDRQTQHGRTQGAVLSDGRGRRRPPNVEPSAK